LPIALTVTNQTRISGDDTINAGEKLVGTHAYNALCGSTALSDGN
jgi:hypothetical protein